MLTHPHRAGAALAAVALTSVLLATPAPALAADSAPSTCTVSDGERSCVFSFTGQAPGTWTVPADFIGDTFTAVVVGGSGGNGAGEGGRAGAVVLTAPAQVGDQFLLGIGGAGADGMPRGSIVVGDGSLGFGAGGYPDGGRSGAHLLDFAGRAGGGGGSSLLARVSGDETLLVAIAAGGGGAGGWYGGVVWKPEVTFSKSDGGDAGEDGEDGASSGTANGVVYPVPGGGGKAAPDSSQGTPGDGCTLPYPQHGEGATGGYGGPGGFAQDGSGNPSAGVATGGGGGGGLKGGGGGGAGGACEAVGIDNRYATGGGGAGGQSAFVNEQVEQGAIGVSGDRGNGLIRITYAVADQTPPETTIDSAPAVLTASGSATFEFSGSDGVDLDLDFFCSIDGAEPVACTSPATYTGLADGQHTFTVYASDRSGNNDTSPAEHSWSIDTIAPTLAPSVASPLALGDVVTVDPGATDSGSGVADASCNDGNPLDTSSAGTFTIECSATDVAGNQATESVDYRVAFGFGGFGAPLDAGAVNVVKAGRTVPLVFTAVAGVDGTPADLSGADVKVRVSSRACDLGDTPNLVEESAAGQSGLQHLGGGTYQYNWATPKAYAGSCKTLELSLGDGAVHAAEFSFTR
ncbi:PxKF domain-containing protein [Agromyces sp. SYSU T00266]|uniref:PxKF domain-containing protein n=1 Tax=Agromyces zhanjiangensis TaxID=3158562 RepID=UPI00339A104F